MGASFVGCRGGRRGAEEPWKLGVRVRSFSPPFLALVVGSHARARGAGRDEGGWIGASAARVGTVASRRGGDVRDARGGGETMAFGNSGEG